MIRLLSLLLLGQLILTAGLYWPDDKVQNTSTSLVDSALFSAQSPLSQIEITAGDDSSVVLERADEQWALSSGLPVDEAKVQTLLDALMKADAGFAIATSMGAARRFEVSEALFERKVTLTGAKPVTVFLGSAPSYRKLYARSSNSNDIKIISLNAYDVATNEAGWLNRSLLAQTGIETLSVDNVAYQLESDMPIASDSEPQASLAELVQALAKLQVTSNVADAQAPNSMPILALTASGNGREQQLSLFEDDAEAYFVKSSWFSQTFSISAYDAERLLEAATNLR